MPRQTRGAGRPSDLKEGELRNAIRDAAISLFGEKGYEATTIQDIATRAGTTKPMLYYYFQSKENLLQFIIRDVHDQNITVMQQVLDQTGRSVVDRIHKLARIQNERLDNSPEVLRFFHRLTHAPPRDMQGFDHHAMAQRYAEMIRTLVMEGLEQGELKGDPDVITASLQAVFQYSVMMRLGPKTGRPQLASTVSIAMFNHLLNGIRGPKGPGKQPLKEL